MKRSAFTLIEILVAVAVFATALVIVTGIFSSILGNQSSVATQTAVNKDAERIIRQISDDVVNAIGIGLVTQNNSTALNPLFKPKGILFLDNFNKPEEPVTGCQLVPVNDFSNTHCNFNGIVLFSKSGLKIYRFNPSTKTVDYSATDSTTLKIGADGKISSDYKFQKLNNDNIEVLSTGFRGIGCYNDSCNLAPFVKINFTTQTKDYATKSARKRARLQLQTMVAGRSY